MLDTDVALVDSAWDSIGMSRPEYLAWLRIKEYIKEVRKLSYNNAMNKICGSCYNPVKKHWKYCQECKSLLSAVDHKLSSVA